MGRRKSSSNILPRVRLGIFFSVEGEREAEVYYQVLVNEGVGSDASSNTCLFKMFGCVPFVIGEKELFLSVLPVTLISLENIACVASICIAFVCL